MPKHNVMFARFPYKRAEEPEVADWLLSTVLKAKRDSRIGEVFSIKLDDTPITMTRNLAVEKAKSAGADLLLMLDSDMVPDLPIPGAKPFWDTSLDFVLSHQGPSVIAAPYCGPPPVENVYVFQWRKFQSDHPGADWKLDQFTREEAAYRAGIERVAALPTGLILIDMRIFSTLKPPYFYYEWEDETESRKGSTEDVAFTRDLSMAGVPVYCNWDAWAGHVKYKVVGKPELVHVDMIREKYREALQRGLSSDDRVVMVGDCYEGPGRE